MSRSFRSWALANQHWLFPCLDIPLFGIVYLYIILAGQHLSPSDFGHLNAALALYQLIAVIGFSLQTVVARRIAAKGEIPPLGSIFGICVLTGVIGGVFFVLPLPAELQMKAVSGVGPIAFALGILLVNTANLVRGILQGQERFLALWATVAFEQGCRLAVFAWLIGETTTLETAWLSVLVALASAVVFALWMVGRASRVLVQRQAPGTAGWKEVARVFVANAGLAYLLTIDLMMASEHLGPAAGAYALANKYGRALYFLGASVAVVLLPRLARNPQGTMSRRFNLGFWLVALLLSIVAAPLGAMVCLPTMEWMFADALLPSLALTSWAFAANLGLAMCQIFTTWHIARTGKHYIYLLAGCGVFVSLALWLGESSGLAYARTTALLFWSTALLLALLKRPADQDAGDGATTSSA